MRRSLPRCAAGGVPRRTQTCVIRPHTGAGGYHSPLTYSIGIQLRTTRVIEQWFPEPDPVLARPIIVWNIGHLSLGARSRQGRKSHTGVERNRVAVRGSRHGKNIVAASRGGFHEETLVE